MRNLSKIALSILSTVVASSVLAQCPVGSPCWQAQQAQQGHPSLYRSSSDRAATPNYYDGYNQDPSFGSSAPMYYDQQPGGWGQQQGQMYYDQQPGGWVPQHQGQMMNQAPAKGPAMNASQGTAADQSANQPVNR